MKMGWKTIERIETALFCIGLVYYFAFLNNPTYFMGETIVDDPMSVMGFGLLLLCLVIARIIQNSFTEKVKMMTISPPDGKKDTPAPEKDAQH